MTKIKDLDQLLQSEDKNGSVIALDNLIGEACTYGEKMEVLTEPQKLFYYNQNLEREVNNGGFKQYLLNSFGDFSHETIVSLRAIGANKTAEILQEVINQFPGNTVPKQREEREKIVAEIETSADPVWESLTARFLEYQDDLNTLNLEYIKNNRDSFNN